MRVLPLPNQRLARSLLDAVPYGERFSAGRLMLPVGMLREDVRSLRELYLLLAPDARSLPGVNLNALAQWIRLALGDHDLADTVEEVGREAGSYAESCFTLFELVGTRLDQAQKVAGNNA